MKKIHFDNMKNWIWILILILSLVFIAVGTFEIFDLENPRHNKWISALGFLLQAVYFSRIFWYKNYVQWNKKGANIKLNSFLGKSLTFDQIKATELSDNKLTLTKKYGDKISFDLHDINTADAQKLHELIVKNMSFNKA